jgi:hypothetical protein
MKKENRNLVLFDIVYGLVILVLLTELFSSGAVSVGLDAAILTFAIAAAMLIVLMIWKEQKYLQMKIRRPWFFRKSGDKHHHRIIHFHHR